MAISTKRNEIGKSVSLHVSLKSKNSERNNMSDRQLFWQLTLVFAAMLASMVISMPRLVPLLSPVWTVVRILAAFPMWTILTAEVISEPFQSADIPAKSFGCGAGRNGPYLTALLTSVCHSIGLASARAITTPDRMTSRLFVLLSASLTREFNLFNRLSTTNRAVVLITKSGRSPAKFFSTGKAFFSDQGIFACQ
jgi:hypothetical protein